MSSRPTCSFRTSRRAAPHPAKLTDFGVARVIGGDSLTRTGDVVGTAAYMAPEQAEGREVGPAADLYAVALVTYEALTGINPVRTDTAAVRARRLGAHLPPLRRQRRDLPRELGRGIDLALRPRPRERGTLDELRTALVASLPDLSDEPGVVVTAWPRLSSRDTGDEDGAAGPPRLAEEDPRSPPTRASSTIPRRRWPVMLRSPCPGRTAPSVPPPRRSVPPGPRSTCSDRSRWPRRRSQCSRGFSCSRCRGSAGWRAARSSLPRRQPASTRAARSCS